MKLENLLEHIKNIRYYKINNDLENIKTVEKISMIDKSIVQHNFNDFLYQDSKEHDIIYTSTSGSTGLVLNIYWNRLEYYKSLYEIWKIRKEFDIYPQDKYCTLHVMATINGNYCRNKVIIDKNNISLSKCFSDKDTVKYYYKSLLDFQPKWMMVQPSFIYGFILQLEELGLKLPPSIKLIELTGEYCSNNVLHELKCLYPFIKWKIMYGMQEFNAIAYGETNHLKVLNKNVYVEIVDDEGNIINSQTSGQIVVTGLKNTFMPFVRYKTGDRGHWDENGNLVIDRSKSNDSIEFEGIRYDGSLFWGVILLINSLYNAKIIQFQVKLCSNILNFYFVTAERKELGIEEIKLFIKNYLRTNYNSSYDIKIHMIDKIEVYENSNKIKYFINEVY